MTQSTDARKPASPDEEDIIQRLSEMTHFSTERCLIARAFQPPKIYQPCTDILPRTMAWLAAGVPMDFIDRVDSRIATAEPLPIFLTAAEGAQDAALEAANLGEYGFAQVPDPRE